MPLRKAEVSKTIVVEKKPTEKMYAKLVEVRIPPEVAEVGKRYPIFGRAHAETDIKNFAIGFSNYRSSPGAVYVYDRQGFRHVLPPGYGIANISWGWSDKCTYKGLGLARIEFTTGGEYRGCIWTGYIEDKTTICVTDHRGWVTKVKKPPAPPPPSPPKPRPKPPWQEWLERNWQWIALGAAVATLAGTVSYIVYKEVVR